MRVCKQRQVIQSPTEDTLFPHLCSDSVDGESGGRRTLAAPPRRLPVSRADFCARQLPATSVPVKFLHSFMVPPPGGNVAPRFCRRNLAEQCSRTISHYSCKTLKNTFASYSEQMWLVSIFRPYLTDNDFFVCFVLYLGSAKDPAQDIDTPPPPTLHSSPFSSSTELLT